MCPPFWSTTHCRWRIRLLTLISTKRCDSGPTPVRLPSAVCRGSECRTHSTHVSPTVCTVKPLLSQIVCWSIFSSTRRLSLQVRTINNNLYLTISLSSKMAPFDRSHTGSYSTSIVTMAVSGVVFEQQRDVGRKTPIFHTPLTFNLYDNLEPLPIFYIEILIQNVRFPTLLDGAKILQRQFSFNGVPDKIYSCFTRLLSRPAVIWFVLALHSSTDGCRATGYS